MLIDPRTVVLIIGICHLMQLLVFYHQYRVNSNINGPGCWIAWSAFEVVGFFLIVLRANPSFLPVAIMFQNLILLSGTVFVYIGITRFFNKKINLKIIIPLLLSFFILHLYFFLIKDDIVIRSLLISVYLSIAAFMGAYSLYKHKTKEISTTANFNAAVLAFHGLVFAYRAVFVLMGTPSTDMFAPSFLNYLMYFDALIVGLLWTFGFIIMLNQKLNFEISEDIKERKRTEI